MARACFVAFLIAGATVVVAGEQPAVNKLTPAQARQGWLLLFDGESTYGWAIDGDAKVDGGTLILGGRKATIAAFTSAFSQFHLSFEYRTTGQKPPSLVLAAGDRPLAANQANHLDNSGDWTTVTVERRMKDGNMVAEITNKKGMQPVTEKGPPAAANVTFSVPGECQLQLRNVKLLPGKLESLFNGKDLTGWKIHPGRKSKFTVTDKGEINVKDGSGDLQSEKTLGDFVLQLECISNGKHLNSGVFFRCKPGEYQQGYEAQIRNEFTAQPTQEYTVEEYEPKTNKLIGKVKVKSPAVDYGTGAIYRRQPARKGVAKDGQWFTMTIVAHGRHFATWVDGIQVCDWWDYRPPADNGRNGYREKAGPISFQGHDPTTDLSFRNIRAAEYPAAK